MRDPQTKIDPGEGSGKFASMSATESRLAWGIIGTGGIARTFAQGLAKSRTGKLVAVGSRQQATADTFAKEFGSIRAHGSYEKLLADPEVQAVYIATPHPSHAEWTIKAARAKKHILCEKPLTLNHPEAMIVVQEARENGVFLMEAFMYRCHPQTARLVELIREGAIGKVQLIKATLSFKALFHPEGRHFNNALGGGAIMDVGCYTTSISRLIAGAAQGLPFANPDRLTGVGVLHPETGTDLYSVATAQFPGEIVAQLSTGIVLNQDHGLQVFGSAGSITVPSPYLMAKEGGESVMFLQRDGAEKPEEIRVKTDDYLYALEADAVGDAVAQGKLESPFVSIDDTLGNMAALDAWRVSFRFYYKSELPSPAFPTVSRQPLRKRADAAMTYGSIDGVSIPMSRVVFGCDKQYEIPYAASMYDTFFERGGNVLDTAYVYGGGYPESMVGHWLRARGVRSQIVLIVKGAHSPLCTPEHLNSQLLESFERLQTDYADIYLMHRDNPAVPVGEFVDVLNEHYRAGRIRTFGGSNWTLKRLQEADAYAAKKGLRRMNCLSNSFSLARQAAPLWDGTLGIEEPEFQKWLVETKTALLPWASQARNFFTDAVQPGQGNDSALGRAHYSPDNFQRRERAYELARKKGVLPINIALAYVLHQPFQTFALIGPRTVSDLVRSMRGASVTLTPQEVRWLNLEE